MDYVVGSAKWDLYDRYISSNDYTNNKLDDLVVLSASISANNNSNNILFNTDNTESGIERRKSSIMGELAPFIDDELCNDINLTGFFPHLDVVTDVKVKSVDGKVQCYEIKEETFYGVITYSDSCHEDNDLNKCLEPVPDFEELVFERNTLNDPLVNGAKYKWTILKNLDELKISGGFTNPTFKCSMKATGYSKDSYINLEYSE